jgi:hypothetical protein
MEQGGPLGDLAREILEEGNGAAALKLHQALSKQGENPSRYYLEALSDQLARPQGVVKQARRNATRMGINDYQAPPRDMDGLPMSPQADLNREVDPLKDHWAAQGADDIDSSRDYPARFNMPRDPRSGPRARGPRNPAVRQLAQQVAALFEGTDVGQWIRKQINRTGWTPGGGSARDEMPDLDHLEPDGESMVSEDWNTRMGDVLSGEEPVRTGVR